MKISQLQPGFKVQEHQESGEVVCFEVVGIAQVGKMFEVTFRSVSALLHKPGTAVYG